ncbi:MAG: hypothetical protein GY699_02230 [Desulfobacteraceae bacterium]|nr:hypothetical protein [Desulfobacteraceae bacterium]
MFFSVIKSNRIISFKFGAIILFLALCLALVESLGFALFSFAVQAAPGSKTVYFIWRIFDYLFFQTFLLGLLCFSSGVLNKLFQLDLSLFKMVFISIAFAVIFYIFIVLQLIDDGIILKTIG